jgi:hypothetical protein
MDGGALYRRKEGERGERVRVPGGPVVLLGRLGEMGQMANELVKGKKI